MTQLDNEQIHHVLSLINKNIKQAKRRNRLLKEQNLQSQLDYQQSARLYLIEKSRMQPLFKLTVNEFLLNKVDYVNDPEHAAEAKFLIDFGYAIDQRLLRIKLTVKGDGTVLHPSLVAKTFENKAADQSSVLNGNLIESVEQAEPLNECLLSMTSRTFFVAVDSLDITLSKDKSLDHSFDLYLVYRDQTTLPVVLKYIIKQQSDSRLLRWENEHVDTMFVESRKTLKLLKNSFFCEQLFADSYV